MCGIAGFVERGSPADPGRMKRTAEKMAESLSARGPDHRGVWTDPDAGVALAHARLSVIDLSEAGHQPMVSSNGRWVLSYNGEIYNAEALRRELIAEGFKFKGDSDSEVLLEACACWGIAQTLPRLNGMYAFALWDRQERALHLVRDRLGIKPLYYGAVNGRILFGSELKALRQHEGWHPEVDRDALASFFRFNYIPSPHSIYKGIFKLKPGCRVEIQSDQSIRHVCHWDFRTIAGQIRTSENDGGGDWVDRLEALLGDSVQRRMRSDVPLGALLSGGIDSTAVVALMQKTNPGKVKTYSLGFDEPSLNEAPYAKRVADHLGTDHTEFYVKAADALDTIPALAHWFDEPFADSSQIPMFLVSKLARADVTVALSGDGGDELFAGYRRHVDVEQLWQRIRKLPLPVRQMASGLMETMPPWMVDGLIEKLPMVGSRALVRHARKLPGMLAMRDDGMAFHRRLVSVWDRPERLVQGAREPHGSFWDDTWIRQFPDLAERTHCLDTVTYLPDDILTKADRASMAAGLEVRVPFLDHELVTFAMGLPRNMKIRDGQGKWILRQMLYRHVPQGMLDRPKAGFAVPIGQWLRGPLREWAESLLCPDRLNRDGVLNTAMVRKTWQQHLKGIQGLDARLWSVLMYQGWLDRWT